MWEVASGAQSACGHLVKKDAPTHRISRHIKALKIARRLSGVAFGGDCGRLQMRIMC
jgi:hypothetical protein